MPVSKLWNLRRERVWDVIRVIRFVLASDQRDEELPTLLHFAAKYGLKKLTTVLLQCPGALQAYSVMNKHGDYPNTLAEKSGFSDLRQFMDEYVVCAGMVASSSGCGLASDAWLFLKTRKLQPFSNPTLKGPSAPRRVQRFTSWCQLPPRTSWWSTRVALRTYMSPCWGLTPNVQKTYVRFVKFRILNRAGSILAVDITL